MENVPILRHRLEQLLHTHDTPERTAAAYALGVFFGFSPILGLHTVLGLAFAFGLNLNRVAVLLGVYSNLPWIILPYYTLATWLGAAIMRTEVEPGTVEALIAAVEHLSWADFRAAVIGLKSLVWAFTIGSTIGSIALSLVAYGIAFVLISTHRKHLQRPQGTQL
jgi:uncharacterized protein (DUF2062 family)